jgi:hypothetical protein
MSENERDPRIDAAWRDASREEPPAALDAAIRAAARRAVDAGPQRVRDRHWWYPLAAAATVAVIAVGLLQTTPPEQVAPAIAPATVEETAPAKQEIATSPPAPPAAGAPAPAAKKDLPAEWASAHAFAQKPAPSQPPVDALDKPARVKERSPEAGVRSPAPAASPPAITLSPPRSEPFPAAPQDVARRDAAVEAQNATQASTEVNEQASAAAGARKIAGAVAPAPAALEEKRAQSRVMLAKDADSGQMKPKSARSVEDWVKLIRQLRDERRFDEATKELAAFRAVYGERADALLPPDLRQFSPPAGTGAK